MSELPPRWPPERANAYAAMLHLPYGSEWVAMWNREPAGPGEPLDVLVRRGFDPEHIGYRMTLRPDEARPMLGFTFEMFGRLTSVPVAGGWQIQPAGELDHALNIDRWWMEVPIGTAASARRQRAEDGRVRKWLEILDNGWDPDGGLIVKALRALEMDLRRPGPRPGTGAKYKTAAEWRQAIRWKVLPKTTRLAADDETIAYWLGISSTLMYELMARPGWGPSTLEDLRNGKF